MTSRRMTPRSFCAAHATGFDKPRSFATPGPRRLPLVTRHERDVPRAPPETSGHREVVSVVPDDPERLAIMTIDGDMPEADARAMMKVAPT